MKERLKALPKSADKLAELEFECEYCGKVSPDKDEVYRCERLHTQALCQHTFVYEFSYIVSSTSGEPEHCVSKYCKTCRGYSERWLSSEEASEVQEELDSILRKYI